MRATVVEIQQALRNVEASLRDLGLLRDRNEAVVSRIDSTTRRLTWATNTTGPELSTYADSTIGEYLSFLKGRHFNYMLSDGALVQLSYDVQRQNYVVGTRAVWFPCPVSFTPDDLEMATIEELVLTTPQTDVGCRAPLRMDFAPNDATSDHPSTHMHSGFENFRLPVQRPLEPSRFIRLILRTAYPDVWRGKAENLPCDDWATQDSLTHEDRSVGYLGWNPM